MFAVNKTKQKIPLTLSVDGVDSSGPFSHQALIFEDLNGQRIFAMDDPVMVKVESNGSISLPPLSISRIDLRR